MSGKSQQPKPFNVGATNYNKKVAYALITLFTGNFLDDDGDGESIGTWYVTDDKLAEAISAAKNLEVYDDDIADDDKIYKMPLNSKQVPHLFVPVKDVPTYKSWNRSVATCAYNATNEFLQHWLGMKLDNHDRDWYCAHYLVTPDGLPQQSTFTVLQQLVNAYDAGICRIQVPQNSRRFDEHGMFIAALGANPFFKVDGATSNEEAYSKMYPEVALQAMNLLTPAARAKHKAEQFSQWRFECVPTPAPGAVVMQQFTMESTGHNGGSNYYGPRNPKVVHDNNKWLMAIKFDKLCNIKYLSPLNLPEYKVYDGSINYDWWQIKDGKDGKTLRQTLPPKTYPPIGGGLYGGGQNFNSWNDYTLGQSNKDKGKEKPKEEKQYSDDYYTIGSGQDKAHYLKAGLKELGFTEQETLKMGWKSARDIYDNKYTSKDVSILDSGGMRYLSSSNPKKSITLLEDKSQDKEKDTILCFAPLCETCHKAPGNSTWVSGDLVCQHCGTKVFMDFVDETMIGEGWRPVNKIETLDDTEKFLKDLDEGWDEESWKDWFGS